jgi:hypothetical protein
MHASWASILTVKDGMLAHAVGFMTTAEARQAAGRKVEAADEA